MKGFRYIVLFSLILCSVMLQACGGGGGSSDTAGSLTLSAPTSTSNGDGTYTVSSTVTYTPPAGKSAQGVVVSMSVSDLFGVINSSSHTLTSGSNSFNYSYPQIFQLVGVSNHVSIVSNIGEMKSSVGVNIPALTALSALPIDFLVGEAASPGTTKSTTISGGVGTYVLTSPASVDGVLTISIAGSILTVKYISASTATSASTVVTIRDGVGATLNIPVSYFR